MKRLEVNYTLGSMDVLVSLARYNFVNRTINDSNLAVLDFGCGSGYGSKVLKEKFKDVTSYDIYPDNYTPKDIEVIQDINVIKKRKYDIITCFEVIEHVDEATQWDLMKTLHELTTDNGTLFISTVRKIVPPPTENRRKEHIRELDFNELLQFCKKYYANIYTFGQIDQIISTFYKDNHYHFVFICTGKRKI
jgi:2-polyprenyl-3-methyl-5-hydroxy-6-metoxy-1,4-benzoquinol methylase